MKWFFKAPKTCVKIDGYENTYNFTLKMFVYLNLNEDCVQNELVACTKL